MKLSHQLTATRTLCCLIVIGTFALSTSTAEAQFSFKGIKIPQVRRSTSSNTSNVTQYLPHVIQAAQTLKNAQQQNHQHGHYHPVPKQPVVCPKPAPPQAGHRPVSPPPAPVVTPNVPETKVSLARSLVARAKQDFAAKNYERTIATLGEVLKLVPEDADAYQFRSLAYFAAGEFGQSAADAYDAFRFGNAWTWETLQSVYPEGQTSRYTTQLRTLESVNQSDEQSMSSHFLLAYHYIVMGYLPNAEAELNAVLAINAEEQLSKQLLSVVQNAQQQEKVSQK